MIFGIFIEIFSIFLKLISKVLPSWDLPQEVYYYLGQGAEIFSSLDFIIDTSLIFTAITIIISFEIVVLTFRLVSGLISLLRGGGSVDL